MLSKERIKEAQANIPGYLGQGLLNKLKNPDEAVRKVLINNCEESMKVADLLFKNNYSDLWAIVCSYYAMYYMANAVLYSFGYKVGEKIAHKVTADALRGCPKIKWYVLSSEDRAIKNLKKSPAKNCSPREEIKLKAL